MEKGHGSPQFNQPTALTDSRLTISLYDNSSSKHSGGGRSLTSDPPPVFILPDFGLWPLFNSPTLDHGLSD